MTDNCGTLYRKLIDEKKMKRLSRIVVYISIIQRKSIPVYVHKMFAHDWCPCTQAFEYSIITCSHTLLLFILYVYIVIVTIFGI